MDSGITPQVLSAQRLRPYLPVILAHPRWPLGTNLVEGINNKIKVIDRTAYRNRGDACCIRRIRAELPGVGR